jgi:hypothetical protein
MSVHSTMNNVVTIETVANTKNSSGLNARSWTVRTAYAGMTLNQLATLTIDELATLQLAVGEPLACRVMDLSDKVMLEYLRLGYVATTVFYFATDPLLSVGGSEAEAKNRIVWNGWAFYPQAVQNSGGQLNKLFKVIAVRKPLTYSTSG